MRKNVLYIKLFMDCLSINNKIEQLKLEWQEYDFGDTLYAKMPIVLLQQQLFIEGSCETSKYKIEFQPDGNAYIFQEMKQAFSFGKIFTIISEINKMLSKQERKPSKTEKQSIDY